jgi:putative flippase GtrA
MRQFVRFCLVGASNTGLSFITYVVAVRAGAPYLVASCGAFALGALNGYSLNRVWTFRAGSFTFPTLVRYGLVQGLGLSINAGLLAVLVEGLQLDSIAAQALVLPAVSVLTFSLSRRWVFAGGRAPESPAAGPSAERAHASA